MVKRIYSTLFLCFVCHFINVAQYSEELNSLLKDVKEASFYDSTNLFQIGTKTIHKAVMSKNDKGAVAEVYLYYGNYFYYTRNVPRAKNYLAKSIQEADKTNNVHIKTLSNIRLIFMKHEEGLNQNIENDFRQLLTETKIKKDYENTSEIINLLGIIKEEKNQLQEAAKLYMEGLAFSESHSITHYPAVFRNNLGLIKLYADQTDDALIDFEKGLEIAKKENDRNLASHIQINICLIYVRKNRVNEALKLFNEVVNYSRINNHPRELSVAFVNLGSAFNTANKPEMALSYLDSAINILQKTKLNVELLKAYLVKTEILIDLSKNNDAKKTLTGAKGLFEKSKNLDDQAMYYFLLYKIEKSEAKYKVALDYFLSYRTLKDSMEQILNGKIIQELQLQYNVQKKEVELEKEKIRYLQLEKTSQDERFLKWLSIGIALIILILVISFVSYRYSIKLREKQESFSRQLIENIEEDRLRISMDLHDDIGQSLSMIKAKISQSNTIDNSLENELTRVIEQTREISRNLYPSYLEKIGLVRSIAQLMENIQSSSHLECSFDVFENVETLPILVKTHIYRILQECTNNTLKHAKASALKISITKKEDEFILVYQDNGIGLTTKQKSGLGLLSIQERAKIINGSVSFENKLNKSFRLTLKFND